MGNASQPKPDFASHRLKSLSTTFLDSAARGMGAFRKYPPTAVLEHVLKALLHKLMTGKIKVGDLEFTALSTAVEGAL